MKDKTDYSIEELQSLIGPQWMYRLGSGGGWMETGLYRKNPNQWRKFEEEEVFSDLCKRIQPGEDSEILKGKLCGTSQYCNGTVEFKFFKRFKKIGRNPYYPLWSKNATE